MRASQRRGRSIVILAGLLAAGGPALAQVPANLRADGVKTNRHVLSFTPTLCWDFAGSQTNWQVQVDDDPAFTEVDIHGNGIPQVWFWDSGVQGKGPSAVERCAVMRGITKVGFVSISLDRRAYSIYWRVRVQAGGLWGPWVGSTLRMNQIPLMPAGMAVAADTSPSGDPIAPVPPKAVGRSFYVAPAGSDLAAGTQAAPFRTLGRAMKALAKGDTLLVRGGVYNENLEIATASGYASGERGNPITVKAYPGESAVLRAVPLGSRIALTVGPSSDLSDWVFDGLTFGGASAVAGVYLSGVRSTTVKNCSLEGTLPSGAIGIAIADGSEEARVVGCVFDQPIYEQIDIGAASHVEIRGNDFSRFDGHHAIQKHGPAPGNLIIADNRFHDGSPSESAVSMYLGAAGTRIVNNVFANITDSPLAYGVLVYRSGEVTIENNVFYNVEDAGIQLNEMSHFGTYRNNIFARCGSGIRFRGGIVPGSSTIGTVVDYNLFHLNGADVLAAPADLALLAHPMSGNCLGSSCDPRFVSPATGDFRLQAGSPAIDAGDPESPVPLGGGARVDIGRFESGAGTPPYDYEPRFSVADPTPRFSWDIRDLDNDLASILGEAASGDPDYQTKFQIQIDPRPTFDSLSEARPLIDSGIVASLSEAYTPPDAAALAPGQYYARVRQWDDHDFNAGAWSDHGLRFSVGGEPQPPYLAGQVPAPGAAGVASNTTIVAHVKDNGVGVSLSTIRMDVDGGRVSPVITGAPADYTLTFAPPRPFPGGAVVRVRITAQDLAGSPPGLDAIYTFTVRDTTPPQPPRNVRVTP